MNLRERYRNLPRKHQITLKYNYTSVPTNMIMLKIIYALWTRKQKYFDNIEPNLNIEIFYTIELKRCVNNTNTHETHKNI